MFSVGRIAFAVKNAADTVIMYSHERPLNVSGRFAGWFAIIGGPCYDSTVPCRDYPEGLRTPGNAVSAVNTDNNNNYYDVDR